MKNKSKGVIFFSKKIKDNDLYIRILSADDKIHSGMVYGGNSSKKKLIYQIGYFLDYFMTIKNENSPPIFTGEISKPYLGSIFADKYKLNGLLSVLSLINLSIVEGQYIKYIYNDIENLAINIINKHHWIVFYCEWLFLLLKRIGYQIDYKNNNNKKYYDIIEQKFINLNNTNAIEFPHSFFLNSQEINFKNINAIFVIFESIFLKNHLDNINYKMPINFINFKKIILFRLKSKYV